MNTARRTKGKYITGKTLQQRDQHQTERRGTAAHRDLSAIAEMVFAQNFAMASTPEGGEEYSNLTRLQRYSYAAGAVGVWGPLVAFSALRSTIYVIYLEAVRVHAAMRARVCIAFRCSCTCQRVRMRTRARLAGAPASTPHAMPAPRGARPRGARPTRGARPPH